MVAQNTQANFLRGAWANVVHTPVNGVKSAGNGVESTVNGMKSPRNAVKNPGNPGTFFQYCIKEVVFRIFPTIIPPF